MSVGELNVVFNSQTQLNNDWFISKNKGDPSFQNVLENKAKERSDVKEAKPLKKSEISKTQESMKAKASNIKETTDASKDVKEVKENLKKAIAKQKMKKEVDGDVSDGEVSAEDLEKQIEALEQAFYEKLGTDHETKALMELAGLLGMTVDELLEGLSDPEQSEAIIEKIITLLETGALDATKLEHAMKAAWRQMGNEQKVEFAEALDTALIALPEASKEELTQLFSQVQSEDGLETVEKELPADVIKTEQSTTENKVSQVNTVEESSQVKESSEVMEMKDEQPKEQSSRESSEPLSNVEVKKVQTTNQQTFNIEEQIGLMKTESQTPITVKETPKEILSKSIMNQVVQGTKMSINMSDQGSEILVKLNPKNLGNVSLKMAFDKGTLLAQIQVENTTVKGIIESNLDDLKSALREEGYEVGDLDVSVNKENTGEQQQQHFSQQKKQFVKHETFEEVEEKILQQKMKKEGFDYLA